MECDGKVITKKDKLRAELKTKLNKFFAKWGDPLFVLGFTIVVQILTMACEYILVSSIAEYEGIKFTMLICTYFIILTIKGKHNESN